MNQPDPPQMDGAPLPLPEPDGLNLEDYRIHDRREIAAVLRDIIKRRPLVRLGFGPEFIITSLLALDPETGDLLFDAAREEAANARIRAAQRLQFVAAVDSIKTQFETEGAENAVVTGTPALRTRLPASVLRLQRRSHFRVETPRAAPLVCSIPIPGGTVVQFVIGDLSVGGIAVLMGPDPGVFQPGAVFDNCSISLPEHDDIATGIEIRYLVATGHAAAGRAGFRFGCRFLNLAGTVESLLQRYINQLERERRALL